MVGSNSTSTRRRSIKGVLVCVAMFAAGGLVLWGLFRAPHPAPPPAAPADVPAGVPDVPLRFATYDVGRDLAATEAAAGRLSELKPDFVMLRNVAPEQVLTFAATLGMQASYHPHLFQRVGRPGDKGAGGCLLLSRHPLYGAEALAGATGQVFGVRAHSVVGGRRFAVACVDSTAAAAEGAGDERTWVRVIGAEGAEDVPVVVGGTDVIAAGGTLIFSPGWHVATQERHEGPAPGRPIDSAEVAGGTGALDGEPGVLRTPANY